MTVVVQRLGKTFVARIDGVDVSRPLDRATLEAIDQAWLDNRVLSFPGQNLSEPQLLDFSRHFGPLEKHVLSEYHNPDFPEILMLATVNDPDKPKGLADAGSYWHSDVSYKAKPSRASALYAIEVPETGGDTLFCDMVAAYEALSDEMKQRLDGLEAVHSYDYRTRLQVDNVGVRKALSEDEKRETPDVIHPVVRTQPGTGRKALFINPGFTVRILGMSEEESEQLKQELFEHCLQDAFCYRYHWQKGDLLTWDNAVTMHCATVTELPPNSRRTMWRTIISGDRPI